MNPQMQALQVEKEPEVKAQAHNEPEDLARGDRGAVGERATEERGHTSGNSDTDPYYVGPYTGPYMSPEELDPQYGKDQKNNTADRHRVSDRAEGGDDCPYHQFQLWCSGNETKWPQCS